MDIKQAFSEVPRQDAEQGSSRGMDIKEVFSEAPGRGTEQGSSRGMDIKKVCSEELKRERRAQTVSDG